MKVRDGLLVLAGAVVALVIAGIVLLVVDSDTATAPTQTTAPTQSPAPTAYQRRLTATEVEGLLPDAFLDVSLVFYNGRLESAAKYDAETCAANPFECPPDPDTIDVIQKLEDCEVLDFNERSRDWIVQCSRFGEKLSTGVRTATELENFRFNDETEDHEHLGFP